MLAGFGSSKMNAAYRNLPSYARKPTFRTWGSTLSPTLVSNHLVTLSAPTQPGSERSPSMVMAPLARRMERGGPGLGEAARAAGARRAMPARRQQAKRSERALVPQDMKTPRGRRAKEFLSLSGRGGRRSPVPSGRRLTNQDERKSQEV